MDICEGQGSHRHDKIVHEEGWGRCPYCASLDEFDSLQESFDEKKKYAEHLEEEYEAMVQEYEEKIKELKGPLRVAVEEAREQAGA